MWCLVFLIVCSSVILVTQAVPVTRDPYAEDMEKRNQIALECIDQVKIDKKIVVYAIHNINDLPTDNKYKEYLACSYKKQKFQDENGEMLYENIYDFLTRFYNRNDLKVLEQCKTITANSDGEMAYSSLKCILKGLHGIEKVKGAESEK